MFNIRPAVVGDAARIAEVHIQAWHETYRGLIADDFLNSLSADRRAARWAASLSDPADTYHHVLAAEVNGEIAGFASYGDEREKETAYRGELFAIYILRLNQGSGIGRALVCAAAGHLLERGIQSMLVWVLGNNPARGFYERLGGLYLREKKIELGGEYLSEVAYGWRDVRQLAGLNLI